MQKYKKFRETPNFSYLCIHGKASGQDIRRAETLLGLHRIPARTGAYHPFGDGRARHPGPDAHGRRKVAYLPDPRACAGGAVHRRDAPDRPDERPGRPPAGTAHPGRGDPFGALAACNRHRAGQLRLRRRQVPLRRPRAARNGGLPPARRAHERIARGRRRSPLHLTVGLRFPPLVPAHRRAAREVARCPGAGAHGLGHETRGRRHHAPPAVRRTAYPAEQLRTSQPFVQRPPHRRQERAAAAPGTQRPRFGHRLRPYARRHRAGRRHAAQGGYNGRGLPRGHGACRTLATTGGVGLGQDARDGRHQRLRHGHRQTRRALRRPLQHVRLARELLPGGRPSGPRRHAELRPAAGIVGRRRTHRAAFRAGIPAARKDQGHLRTGLLLPAGRHRRRRPGIVPVQHPRLLRPRAPLLRHGRRAP